MCVLCYLSTDRPLETIPFDEANRAFYLEPSGLRPKCLTRRFVYYCGSWQGCGLTKSVVSPELWERSRREFQNDGKLSDETLGIWFSNAWPPESLQEMDDDQEEFELAWRDRRRLERLIRQICDDGFDCQFLVCWADSENRVPNYRYEISLPGDPLDFNFDANNPDRSANAANEANDDDFIDFVRVYHIRNGENVVR